MWSWVPPRSMTSMVRLTADDIEINATGVDTATVGTYQVFYSAFDTAGNLGTATRTVEVVPLPDTTPPVITLLGDNPLTLTEGDPYTDPGATASTMSMGT